MEKRLILVINTGSTSTKVAVYKDMETVFNDTIRHQAADLAGFSRISEQRRLRFDLVKRLMAANRIDPACLSAVIGRGGLLKPIEGGVWRVNRAMLDDLTDSDSLEHASNLSALIAHEIAEPYRIPAFIADPVVVDEMEEEAKITGFPAIKRRSVFHALNQKACARAAAAELGKDHEQLNLIVAHLGGGISVGAHRRGRVVDVNNALDGEGPFSPERAGSLPADELIALCFNGQFCKKKLLKMISQNGGLKAYFGVTDVAEIEKKALSGPGEHRLVYQAMILKIGQEIAKHGATLAGEIDAVVLTGGLAHSRNLVAELKKRVAFLAPVLVYAGENEMTALRDSALRVMRGQEEAKTYGSL